ncbi:hypothetical protein BH18CHL2_BH18CHL2_00300 [soil metagenome]
MALPDASSLSDAPEARIGPAEFVNRRSPVRARASAQKQGASRAVHRSSHTSRCPTTVVRGSVVAAREKLARPRGRALLSSPGLFGLGRRGLCRGRRTAGSATVTACTHEHPPRVLATESTSAYGWRVRSIDRVRGHGGRDGQWIRCDPGGHCRWIARTPVHAARLRIYEAGRGSLAPGTRIENSCGEKRCVNLDHLQVARGSASQRVSNSARLCGRGHELTAANVVRHRDGRIAYCRICRNESRRERYRADPAYAGREIERQRRLRRRRA